MQAVQSDYFAYRNPVPAQEAEYCMVRFDDIIYLSKPKRIQFLPIPAPKARAKRIVYLPTLFWYKEEEINYVEPIFHGGVFQRFIYHLKNKAGLVLGEDFHLSKRKAILTAWSSRITVLLFRLTGKV